MDKVTRSYRNGEKTTVILDAIDLVVSSGEFVALVGKSGSGKSTLLNLAGCMDFPDSGKIYIDSRETTCLSSSKRALVRREQIGFVFQFFHLLPQLTVAENVSLPLTLTGYRKIEARVDQLLESVGMADYAKRYPAQLSGGEMQRVAVARAISTRPKLILADEPTGNLDDDSSHGVMDLLINMTKECDSSLVLVTHDLNTADRADRKLHIGGGQLYV